MSRTTDLSPHEIEEERLQANLREVARQTGVAMPADEERLQEVPPNEISSAEDSFGQAGYYEPVQAGQSSASYDLSPKFPRKDTEREIGSCEYCGNDIFSDARFCPACGYPTDPSSFRSRINRGYRSVGRTISQELELARHRGWTLPAIIAFAVAAFCMVVAIVTQLTMPDTVAGYTPGEIYIFYVLRSLLWLTGAITALLAAILFKEKRHYE